MTGCRVLLLLVAATAAMTAAGCGGGKGPAQPTSIAEPPGPTTVDVSRFSAPGSFATTSTNASTCTIFMPSSLGQEGITYPVVLWGNGTGTTPAIYRGLLTHLASHGFIVGAANTSNAGDGSQMLDCLTFLIDQNSTGDSQFFHHVDIRRVGASGHSQGGAGAIMAGRDGRVSVTAPLQPFILPIAGGGAFQTASISQQQGPMFLMSGGFDLVAVPDVHQRPVFNGANTSVVWGTLVGAGHTVPAGDAGGFRGPLTAWFRARLMNDVDAAQLFPPVCTLCATAGWSVVSK